MRDEPCQALNEIEGEGRASATAGEGLRARVPERNTEVESLMRHISDRVAVMYLGRIVELAEVETLYRNPVMDAECARVVPPLEDKGGGQWVACLKVPVGSGEQARPLVVELEGSGS